MLNINDVITVLKDNQQDIKAGESGTVVHIFDACPPVYEIEFTDNEGRTIKTATLKEEDVSIYWTSSNGKHIDTL